MRILVTGGAGFAGRHLLRYLKTVEPTAQLFASTLHSQPDDTSLIDIEWIALNLHDTDAVIAMMRDVQPDVVYHLAAQSAPSRALNAAWETLESNIKMQYNLIYACIELAIQPRLLLITSGNVYDTRNNTGEPISENTNLCPTNPYALSKVTQDMMGLQYFLSHQLPIIRIRPFNHTGAGQALGFAASDFAMQIANIEARKQAPIISVGNLNAERDFTDVRDVVRAYHLINKYGEIGDVYNVASGRACSISTLLHTLISFTEINIDVQVDSAKLRPVDTPVIVGSAAKLNALTGWKAEIDIQTTLHDLLNDYRQRVKQQST